MVAVLVVPLGLALVVAATAQPPAIEVDAAAPLTDAVSSGTDAELPSRSLFGPRRRADGVGLWSHRVPTDAPTTTSRPMVTTATTAKPTATTAKPTTTTTAARKGETAPTTAVPPPPPPTTAPRPVGQPGGPATPQELAALACIRQRESGGNYAIVSANGLYHGAYQFLQSTWNGAAQMAGRPDLVGVPPEKAAPADQDAVALALYRASGLAPWGGHCP